MIKHSYTHIYIHDIIAICWRECEDENDACNNKEYTIQDLTYTTLKHIWPITDDSAVTSATVTLTLLILLILLLYISYKLINKCNIINNKYIIIILNCNKPIYVYLIYIIFNINV